MNVPAVLTSSPVPCPPVHRGSVESKSVYRFPQLPWLEKQDIALKKSSSAFPRTVFNALIIWGFYYFSIASGVTVEQVVVQ